MVRRVWLGAHNSTDLFTFLGFIPRSNADTNPPPPHTSFDLRRPVEENQALARTLQHVSQAAIQRHQWGGQMKSREDCLFYQWADLVPAIGDPEFWRVEVKVRRFSLSMLNSANDYKGWL